VENLPDTMKEENMSVLEFDPILYNEAIYYLETAWNRKLTEHERHIAVEIYKWTRTNIEAEELKILEAR
jgi:hypothetical protein